jgi:signal transduction histidine kinase
LNLLPRTPPAVLAFVSLVLIVLTAMATGHVQSSFFRDAAIQREAVIVRELATAIAARELRGVSRTPAADTHPARVKELLGEIRKAGEHCSGYVQRMLSFTQLARSEPQPVALNAVVQETAAFFRQTVGTTPEILCKAMPSANRSRRELPPAGAAPFPPRVGAQRPPAGAAPPEALGQPASSR